MISTAHCFIAYHDLVLHDSCLRHRGHQIHQCTFPLVHWFSPAAPTTCLQYTFKEPVKLWVNKIGPFNNPQETYNYYYLPFCKPKSGVQMERSWGGLGETLQGNELINSQLLIEFGCE